MRRKASVVSYVELDDVDVSELRMYADVYTPSSEGLETAKQQAEAVLCVQISDTELRKLKNLKLIQGLAAGVDSLPWASIPEHVVVCGNMGSNAEAVAEHAWALLLAASKRLHVYLPRLRMGDFRQDVKTILLGGKTLAVVGIGAIGRRVAEIGKAFGMRVVGVSRSGSSPAIVDMVVGPDRLDEVLAESDFVVLAAPLSKQTRGMINLRRLRLLKKNVVVVNVGRAELIDRNDLKVYMKENPDACIATDVWWSVKTNEPWETELFEHPNFTGTPWVAGAFGNPEVLTRMKKHAIENLVRYFRGEKPRNIIDRSDYV
ncbi:MAG: 2-hydroxyacid dehydrogenase [Candidatus Caldarchaeum sp.]